MTGCELLDFERAWPRHTGRKETAIRERGLTPARYYVLLSRAAASLEGQAHDAEVAHRVIRRGSLSTRSFRKDTPVFPGMSVHHARADKT